MSAAGEGSQGVSLGLGLKAREAVQGLRAGKG
jgi:hypothetical protein